MKPIAVCALMVALLLAAADPALAQTPQRDVQRGNAPQASASPAERQAAVAHTVSGTIRPWMGEQSPPGVMVVVRERGVTHLFPFGQANQARGEPVTADSIFELASITKVFCTTSLAMEVEGGQMRLNDSVAKYIPLLAHRGGDIRRVTLEQLATHTSSLPRAPGPAPGGKPWDPQMLLDWAAKWKAPHPPGTRSLYSNVAVGLLGQAIATHERRPLIDVWHSQFLDRLNMQSTYFDVPSERLGLMVQGYGPKGQPVPFMPPGCWSAGGRLKSSGRDMAEFLVANLGERPDLPKITGAMKFAQRPYFKVSAKMVQGLSWQRVHLGDELVIDKNGGLAGTSTYIGMIPEHRLGVVILANRGKCNATGIGRKLLLALAGKQHEDGDETDAGADE
jgi:beta-lactamase class C